jgi:hypothetical protein
MMTSQAYQADDDQLTQAHDQAVPEEILMEPVSSQTEPDADLMPSDTALPEPGPDQAEPDADQTWNENPASQPVIAAAPADLEPSPSTASDYPAFTPEADGGTEEPGMASNLSLVPVTFTAPEPATDSLPAASTASANGPWNEIQALFVDDPRASIERAAGLVDDRVEELIQSVRERQHSMQAGWQATYAGTEELRVALQHYRTFWNSLEDLPVQV